MSFSVRATDRDFEYCGRSLNSLFAQRTNLLRPRFYRLLREILRFNSEAPRVCTDCSNSISLGDFLSEHRFSTEFVDCYLVPMAAAIWSALPSRVLEMPVAFLVRFFSNHGLLQLRDRPIWRVIEGGSREYVTKLVAGHRDRIRVNCPVRALRRVGSQIEVYSDAGGREVFDYAFVACHSDQAIEIIEDPTPTERQVLSTIRYQSNQAILHTDESLLPRRRRAWAAWNYHIPQDNLRPVAVTYNMNRLQGLAARNQYCVTVNFESAIDQRRIIQRFDYQHPVFDSAAIKAQRRHREVNSDRTFFCGAYWRNGFHEDGVVSALRALDHFREKHANEELHIRRAS